MSGRGPMLLMAGNLVALLALAAIYPHLMLSPGPLVAAHASIRTDCLACHAPWRGATAARCIACHAVADIGVRTTAGASAHSGTMKVAFHQQLREQDCMACHAEHLGPRVSEELGRPFAHTLLDTAVRAECARCHERPTDQAHRNTSIGCATCHTTERWKPSEFSHARLDSTVLAQCAGCHAAPVDALHRQVKGTCGACHSQVKWKPATFEHARYFVLDRDHNVSCATCHVDGAFGRYTCYGCHEHTESNVRRKHEEEGIRNFTRCAQCHRDARGESGEGGGDGAEPP